MNLHHVGYVVFDITTYSAKLNLPAPLCQVYDPVQQAGIALFKGDNKGFIELIQPLNHASPTWNFLHKNGEGLHHQCYECSEGCMREHVSAHRLIKVMGPVPAVLFGGRTVYFFITRKGEVAEFLMS